MSSQVAQIADWLTSSSTAVAFTGAGVSTDSGIPDFRSPGGVWSRQQPVYFEDFVQNPAARYEYWRQKSASHREFHEALPNLTHQCLAEWEAAGWIRGVVTQNIDGLHQLAGSRQVLELHGTARQVACLSCAYRVPAEVHVEQFLQSDQVPDCPECGGLLKHATVSFGQSLPESDLTLAAQWCQQADLLLALGSSLVVTPAAELPRLAVDHGARLVIVNRDPTPLDAIAHAVIPDALYGFMKKLRDHIQKNAR